MEEAAQGLLFRKEHCRSSQSQKPTAAYRLGVHIGKGLDGKFCWVEDFPRVELRIARGS
jgi:hypothetical protein